MPHSVPQWPAGELFLPAAELAARAARCLAACRQCLAQLRIDADPAPLVEALYLPLGAWLRRRAAARDPALVVGVCGAQGSGKTTFSQLLSAVLRHGFGLRVAVFSLDDLYLTHEQRQSLARERHPLFATRGVPGTHDVDLGIGLIESLRRRQTTRIPVFDKASDDRLPEAQGHCFQGPAEVIVFEGWCVGARPQAEAELAAPANALERDEDPDGAWRMAVNRALAGPYQNLFGLIDVLLLLKVESLEQVLNWRQLQERKLRQASAAEPDLRIMAAAEVERFVMHFERLTRHILAEMPDRADIALRIDQTHDPAAVRINKPLRHSTGDYAADRV